MTTVAEPITQQPLEKPAPKPNQLFPSEIEEMQSQDHEVICAEFTSLLRHLFRSDQNANVGGDQAFYWNSEDDNDRVVPDAYLIRNAGKNPRKSWKLWEERAIFPNLSIEFVLEVWSEGNTLLERNRKRRRYELLGAREFFELDREAGLAGLRLIDGHYEVIEPNDANRFQSGALGAEIAFEDGLLRLYRNGARIPTFSEAQAVFEAQLNAERQRAEAEREAKEAALAELEQLKKQLGKA